MGVEYRVCDYAAVHVWVSFFLPRQVVKPLISLREAVDHAAQGERAIWKLKGAEKWRIWRSACAT